MCFQRKSNICLICLLLYFVTSNAQTHEHKPDTTNTEETEEKYDSDIFLNRLMSKYGNGETLTMDGFSHLLYHLGLGGSVVLDSHDKFEDHEHENVKGLPHDHDHSDMQIRDHEHHSHDHNHTHNDFHEHSVEKKENMNNTTEKSEILYDKLDTDQEPTEHVHEDREKRDMKDGKLEQVSWFDVLLIIIPHKNRVYTGLTNYLRPNDIAQEYFLIRSRKLPL